MVAENAAKAARAMGDESEAKVAENLREAFMRLRSDQQQKAVPTPSPR
jgi:hypothetical protein